MLSDEGLVTFSRTAPGIAEGLGFGALCRNLVDLKRIDVARGGLITRRLASVPGDVLGLDLRARLDALRRSRRGRHPLQWQPSRPLHRATTRALR